MSRYLLHSRCESRSTRLNLEELESRKAPAGAIDAVAGAIQDAALQLQVLQMNTATGNYGNVNLGLQNVNNDFAVLQSNAPSLDNASRIQVDNALISNGVMLAEIGANIVPQNPTVGFNLAVDGVNAVFAGYLDEYITSQLSGLGSAMA